MAKEATARVAVEARAVAVGATLLRAAALWPVLLQPSPLVRVGLPLRAWITWHLLLPVVHS